MEKGWAEVYLTEQEYQAIMARDVLGNNGILAIVLDQHDSTYKTFGEYRVLVPSEMADKAIDLLKDLIS